MSDILVVFEIPFFSSHEKTGQFNQARALYRGSGSNHNLIFLGLLAQLVARLLDMEEVTGSSPVETTRNRRVHFQNFVSILNNRETFRVAYSKGF